MQEIVNAHTLPLHQTSFILKGQHQEIVHSLSFRVTYICEIENLWNSLRLPPYDLLNSHPVHEWQQSRQNFYISETFSRKKKVWLRDSLVSNQGCKVKHAALWFIYTVKNTRFWDPKRFLGALLLTGNLKGEPLWLQCDLLSCSAAVLWNVLDLISQADSLPLSIHLCSGHLTNCLLCLEEVPLLNQ